jgi:cytoskeletal protein CcmA (bactofilin family)
VAKPQHISIIDVGFAVEGRISFGGSLLVRGTVSGRLEGDTVTIAEEGEVAADVSVAGMTIGGRFEGDLRVRDELVILPTGQCAGRIECGSLVMQEGGLLNAHVRFLENKDAPKVKALSAPDRAPIEL